MRFGQQQVHGFDHEASEMGEVTEIDREDIETGEESEEIIFLRLAYRRPHPPLEQGDKEI